MDDVWTTEDWDKLQIALPKNNKIGKVLITSRREEVARYANHSRLPHNLRFLTPSESWLLFQLEVFGKPECPSELQVYGKFIVEQCDRLPLAIGSGGILAEKFSASNEMSGKRNAWKRVSECVSTFHGETPQRRLGKTISLSYHILQFHLRACFLYFGMFPDDFEIPVWKLIRMWIAEGFVQEKPGISLEETAESYLEELPNRNLIIIGKFKSNGRVKTCRIHDMPRDFCITEGGNERRNFLQEIKTVNGVFKPSIYDLQKYRRLCIHSNVRRFILSLEPSGHRVRSFVCFSKGKITNLPADDIALITAAFKLLRVLDAMPIQFTKIPSNMYHLVHLRYLTLSFNLAILPKAFDRLGNVQTLILITTSYTLEIKADIWKMIQLRHLKANASATLPKPGKSSKGGENLQTLGTISPQSCTEEVFDRARNLKGLSIRGQLSLLLDGKVGSFDRLRKLSNLEKLKLLNDVFLIPASEGMLLGLPPPFKFPPKLRSLTLGDTYLDWNYMSILALLENLEVLKLKDRAFMGRIWEATDGGFRHLEVLHIGRTDLVVWAASTHHFPRLRCLKLHNCENLREVLNITSLEVLDVYHSKFAVASVKKIYGVKKLQGEGINQVTPFRLTIFPPDN